MKTKAFGCLLCLLTSTLSALADQWTQSSPADFAQGQFLDGGSNLYVSAKGRMQIINRWDMNGDGHLDIIMPSGHAHTEKEDTYIYLNNGSDIDGRLQIKLPANGSRDGLIYASTGWLQRHRGMQWRQRHSYAHQRIHLLRHQGGFSADPARTTLGVYFHGIAAGDLNGDGWTDVASPSNGRKAMGQCQRPTAQLRVLTAPMGSIPGRRVAINAEEQITAVAADDLDGDSKCDLVFATGKKLVICYAGKRRLKCVCPVEIPSKQLNCD
jgi:hypothetical protein